MAVAGLPLGRVDAQTAELAPHDPIIIEGDSDLCNLEDLADGRDMPDGIVNCDSADGSPERPYLIHGWNITWNPTEGCRVAPNPIVCSPLPPCALTSVPAALAICGTRLHVRVEKTEVWNAEIAREVGASSLGGVRVPAAAMLVSNVDHLELRDVRVRGGGIALFVEAGKPVPTLPRPGERPIVIDGLDARAWFENAENSVLGPLPDDETVTNVPELSIVRVIDVPVLLRGAKINAVTRDIGMESNATDPSTLFELRDSLISNASVQYGLRLFNLRSIVERNQFVGNGVAGQLLDTGAITIVRGHAAIRNNEFRLEGAGIRLESQVTGEIRENTFVPESMMADPERSLALMQDSNGICATRFHYNDIAGSSVGNEAEDCILDARYNWWNGTPTLLGAGGTATEPQLPRAPAQLPVVRIAGPSPETQVHGRVLVHGTVELPVDFAVARIEGSLVESDWGVKVSSAVESRQWALTWDLTGAPLGAKQLHLRACGAGDDCGIPTRLDLLVIEKPLPPIALLSASPRIATVNEPVRLDASYSYSPQDRPLISYRFDLGNDVLTEWQSGPYYEAIYPEVGEYAVSVQVRDVHLLVSENLPQTLVRVQESHPDEGRTPSLGGMTVVFVLAAIVLFRRPS